MPYKVLYIDDDIRYLSEVLGCWNEMSEQENVGGNTTYPLMKFTGLSFRDNSNNRQAVNDEIHYIDVDN